MQWASADNAKKKPERALIARRASFQAERKDKKRSALEAILSEEPPPTIHAVCKRLGLSESWLYSLYPDLIRAIAARHRLRRDGSMKDRRELSRMEVFEIVADLHCTGEHPSQALVQARLSANAVKDWGTISRFLKEAKRELERRFGMLSSIWKSCRMQANLHT